MSVQADFYRAITDEFCWAWEVTCTNFFVLLHISLYWRRRKFVCFELRWMKTIIIYYDCCEWTANSGSRYGNTSVMHGFIWSTKKNKRNGRLVYLTICDHCYSASSQREQQDAFWTLEGFTWRTIAHILADLSLLVIIFYFNVTWKRKRRN